MCGCASDLSARLTLVCVLARLGASPNIDVNHHGHSALMCAILHTSTHTYPYAISAAHPSLIDLLLRVFHPAAVGVTCARAGRDTC